MFILKHILHGLDNETAKKILGLISKKLDDKNKLLIIEMVMPGRNISSYSKFNDLEMMLMSDFGRERDESEFITLCKISGLKVLNIIPVQLGLCIIECSKNY
jgi:hypothetical protein